MHGAQEAGESFSFPDTITSVSYQLRKAYQNLLWDYEQVYLWRAQGARAPPPSNPAAAARGEPAEGAVRAGRPTLSGRRRAPGSTCSTKSEECARGGVRIG